MLHSPRPRIMKLSSSSTRRARLTPSRQLPRLIFVAVNIEKPANMAHVLRLADALAAEVSFVGSRPEQHAGRIAPFFRPWRSVPRRYFPTLGAALQDLGRRHAQVVALEVSSASKPYAQATFRRSSPVALVVGSESSGLNTAALRAIPKHVHIPMQSVRSCLNVGMALAIVASHIAFGPEASVKPRRLSLPIRSRSSSRPSLGEAK